MAKRGPRPKFRIEMLDEARKLAGLGLTEEDIATYWGIAPQTLCRWKRKNPELCSVIEKGKLEANMSVTKSLYENCKKGNVSAQLAWLYSRWPEKWQDKRGVINNTNINKVTVNPFKDFKDEELDEILAGVKTKRF